MTALLARVRRSLDASAPESDFDLLQRYVADQDEAAFHTLLDRHGSLVRGVCGRILSDPTAADDAFQATFLVLVRKAASIRKGDSLASWLYGVASRVSRQTVRRAAIRNRHEAEAATERPSAVVEDMTVRELRRILDEELERLPEKYRAPILLCCLDGKSRDEAAAELGWSAGALKGRLERGRDLLRDRLAGRGVTLSVALAAVTLPLGSAAAAVPAALRSAVLATAVAGSASTEVAALANAYLTRVLLAKVRAGVLGLLLLGAAGLGVSAFAPGSAPEAAPIPVAARPAEPLPAPVAPVAVPEVAPEIAPPPREPAKAVTEKPKPAGRSSSFAFGSVTTGNGGARVIVGGTSVRGKPAK